MTLFTNPLPARRGRSLSPAKTTGQPLDWQHSRTKTGPDHYSDPLAPIPTFIHGTAEILLPPPSLAMHVHYRLGNATPPQMAEDGPVFAASAFTAPSTPTKAKSPSKWASFIPHLTSFGMTSSRTGSPHSPNDNSSTPKSHSSNGSGSSGGKWKFHSSILPRSSRSSTSTANTSAKNSHPTLPAPPPSPGRASRHPVLHDAAPQHARATSDPANRTPPLPASVFGGAMMHDQFALEWTGSSGTTTPQTRRTASPLKETRRIRKASVEVESPQLRPRSPVDGTAAAFAAALRRTPSPVTRPRPSTPTIPLTIPAFPDTPDRDVPSSSGGNNAYEIVHQVNQYLILREIGEGSFGKVVLVHNTEDDCQYACKIVSKSRLRRRFRFRALLGDDGNGTGARSPQQDAIRHEVAVFKKLSIGHPNVTSLLEVLDDEEEDNLYLVFELCAGPLMTLTMGETVPAFSEAKARKYFCDLALGLDYCTNPLTLIRLCASHNSQKCNGTVHSQHVIHCDIKPENILLTWDDRAQLSDFGISHMLEPSPLSVSVSATAVQSAVTAHGGGVAAASSGQGAEHDNDDQMPVRTASPAFTPPECCDPTSQRVQGRALDVWGLGATLYCMIHGRVPFDAPDMLTLYRDILVLEPEIDETLSPELRSLLQAMLEKDPRKRIKLRAIMAHPWVTRAGQDRALSNAGACWAIVPARPDAASDCQAGEATAQDDDEDDPVRLVGDMDDAAASFHCELTQAEVDNAVTKAGVFFSKLWTRLVRGQRRAGVPSAIREASPTPSLRTSAAMRASAPTIIEAAGSWGAMQPNRVAFGSSHQHYWTATQSTVAIEPTITNVNNSTTDPSLDKDHAVVDSGWAINHHQGVAGQ
ncbi:kinase-like domain-containing protein [Blastocladiella britannica]|nr:kinase-like domain-containing protein [Blastocladiella britannica]